MKIMAVDYGDARTGLAVCDRTEFLSSPIGQIEEKSMAKVAEKIIYASREYDVGMIVIGLPKNMDGTEGARAEKTRKMAALVELGAKVPIVFWDERRTTVTAAAQLSEAGTFGKKRKGKLDAVSAAVILDSFLAWRKNHPDSAAGAPTAERLHGAKTEPLGPAAEAAGLGKNSLHPAGRGAGGTGGAVALAGPLRCALLR